MQQDPGQEGLGPHENPEDEGEVGGVEADSEELGSGGVAALVGEEVKEAVEPGVAGGVDQGPISPGDQTVVGGVGQEGSLLGLLGVCTSPALLPSHSSCPPTPHALPLFLPSHSSCPPTPPALLFFLPSHALPDREGTQEEKK